MAPSAGDPESQAWPSIGASVAVAAPSCEDSKDSSGEASGAAVSPVVTPNAHPPPPPPGHHRRSTEPPSSSAAMVDGATARRRTSVPPAHVPSAGRRDSAAVSFGGVTVREFEVVPSDNPSVSSGAGIELGWRYNLRHDRTPIDKYEAAKRPSTVGGGRTMSVCCRHQRLRQFGYSYEEIYEASRHADKQRKRRSKSVSRKKLDRLYELKEIGAACKSMCSNGTKGSGL